MSSDAILWLEKDGRRWGLEPDDGEDLCWTGDESVFRVAANRYGPVARLPFGADVSDSPNDLTRDDAVALIRKHAPGFGYVVRERVMADGWADGLRLYVGPDRWAAAGVDLDGWICRHPGGERAGEGPETGDAGKAAADRWMTEHAPWVTLEGGAFVVPPPVEVDDVADHDLPATETPTEARRDAAGAMARAVLGQADRMRLDDVVRRVEALEAARGSVEPADGRVRVEVVPVLGCDRVAVRVALADDGHLWAATYGLTRSGNSALLWLSVADAESECAVWRRRLGVSP